jgi:hypothetical protein
MSEDRKRCFESLIDNSQKQIQLVTEENLEQFIVPDSPIHPGFQYLSSTHKSDYLRSYFMYHFGGGYTDIKKCHFSWQPYFDLLENSDKDFIGYTESGPQDVAYDPVKYSYKLLVGNCYYIFKTKTEFAKRWIEETNKKMDFIYNELVLNPGNYHHRAIKGGVHQGEFNNSKYPLEWNELLGRIFHRIQYENTNCYLKNMPYPDLNNYR